MARKWRFKPSLREQRIAVAAHLDFMALGAPEEKRGSAQAFADDARAAIKPKRITRTQNLSANADDPLESEVIRAISQYLTAHPNVFIALRMNSGAASYEAKSGKYAPVMFHKWLRYPEKMRMPDFLGWLKDGRSFAIEGKRSSWTRPRDDREREQAVFLEAIRKMGGTAGFARSVDEARIIIES